MGCNPPPPTIDNGHCFEAGVPLTVEGNCFRVVTPVGDNCTAVMSCEAGTCCASATVLAVRPPYGEVAPDYTVTCEVVATFTEHNAPARTLDVEAGCAVEGAVDFDFVDGALPGTPWPDGGVSFDVDASGDD